MIGKHRQIGVRHHHLLGKGPGIAHADEFTAGAQMMIAAVAEITVIAGHQRVDGDAFAGKRAGQRGSHSLMAKDQRRDAPFIMPVPGMHVGPADAAEGQIDDALPVGGHRGGDITDFTCVRSGIDKRLHFAVNPPSTIRICPVT